jgi:multicomponent Na+:H+ antiporter subunit F
MFVVPVVAILVTMGLAMARALAGPTVYDRILALNVFGTKTVLLIVAAGFLNGRAVFLDIALGYALINFIGVIAMLKFFEHGDLATESANDQPARDA